MGRKHPTNASLSWRPILAVVTAAGDPERDKCVLETAQQVGAALGATDNLPATSHKLFTLLSLGELLSGISSIETEPGSEGGISGPAQLLAIHDVIHNAPLRFTAVLVEQGFVEAIVRLHRRQALLLGATPAWRQGTESDDGEPKGACPL